MKALEDEMCDFGLSGPSSGASPDRLDALVWAVTGVRRVRSAWSADQNAVKRQSEDPVLRCDQRARGTETIHKSDAHGSWHWVMLCIIDRGHGLTGVGG